LGLILYQLFYSIPDITQILINKNEDFKINQTLPGFEEIKELIENMTKYK